MSELRNRARELYQQFPGDWQVRFMNEFMTPRNLQELTIIIRDIELEYSEPIVPLHSIPRRDKAQPRRWYLGPNENDGH